MKPGSHPPRFNLLFVLIPLFAVFAYISPSTDAPDYMRFVDDRPGLGIPHFWNTLSNLPFLLVGLAGGWVTTKVHRDLRPALAVFSVGIFFTAFGSAHFHLNPTPATLFWDRLPMSVSFMALLTLLIADRIDARLGKKLLLPLVMFGALTVWTYRMGWTNLKPYACVQFGGLASVLLIPIAYPRGRLVSGWIYGALASYALAKVAEAADHRIFEWTGGIVSGHSLKHAIAALGVACVVRSAAGARQASSALE